MDTSVQISPRPTGDFGEVYRRYSECAQSPLPRERGEFGNTYLRWTILYAALVVATATLPVWLWFVAPSHIAGYIIAAVVLSFSVEWLVIAFNAVMNYRRLYRVPMPSGGNVEVYRRRKFRHVVIVPCYLDPLEILHACLETLCTQCDPSRLVVVVTFEAKTPDVKTKIESVRSAFQNKFGDFLVVVHVLERSREIPGGCSNKNFALREVYKYVSKFHRNFEEVKYTLTTCDTDSKFHPMYFTSLEHMYNEQNPSDSAPIRMCVWQPPLFYNWDLDRRPFFNRVTCLMRSMMMLGGLISFNLNPMSIFSYPMELGFAAGFINPRYGVDDIIAKVRWMCDTQSSVPVRLLPVGVISGPTIGTTFMEEVNEWGRQIRRWIVGSSESFHYFLIHYRFTPFLPGIVWFFTFFSYYAVLLCSAGIFSVLASLPYPWAQFPVLHVFGFALDLKYATLVSTILQYVAFGVGFGIDAAATSRMDIREDIHPLRNLLHWLSAPLVLLAYSGIAFVSVVRFVFEGKAMARHDMAAKDGFSSGSASPVGVNQGHANLKNLVGSGLN